MSERTYTKCAVTEVKRTLGKVCQRLKTKVTTPMSDKYRAELDASAKLDTERITYFQGLIGVLQWIVELGRIDILVAVSMLSSHFMDLLEGNLEQCFHIFAYLDSHEKIQHWYSMLLIGRSTRLVLKPVTSPSSILMQPKLYHSTFPVLRVSM
jgi:hypothetical protein